MKTIRIVQCSVVVLGLAILSTRAGPSLSGAEFRLHTDLPVYGGDFFVEFETDTCDEWVNLPGTLNYQEYPLGQGYGLVSMVGTTYHFVFPRGNFPAFNWAQSLALYDGAKWNLYGVGVFAGGYTFVFAPYFFSGAQIPPPPNDHFSNQIELNGFPVSTTGTTAGSTVQPGEPQHLTDPVTDSVWWSWTAPQSVRIDIDTFGSSHTMLVVVYTGPSLSFLTKVPGHQDPQNRVRFDASAGSTYRIAVLTRPSSSGMESERDIQLNISLSPPRPANDRFADRLALSGLPATSSGTTVGATADPGEPAHHSFVQANRSVWWRWTAPENGCVVVDISDTSFAPVLAVYTGSSLDSLVQLSSGQRSARFDAQAGTTYQIAVDSLQSIEGDFVLNIRECPDESLAPQVGSPTAPR